jgi:hypothetical protein
MKPKPLVALNHFTVPFAMDESFPIRACFLNTLEGQTGYAWGAKEAWRSESGTRTN